MTRIAILACAATMASAVPAIGQRIKLPAKLSELEQRAQRDSNDAAAHYNVALAYWNAKRWDEVERSLKTAVSVEPGFAEAWLALARLPYARRPALWEDLHENRVPDDWENAVEDGFRLYRRAFMLDPLVDLRIEAAVRPGRSAFWLQSEYHEFIYRYLFQGFEDLNEGRYDAAYNNFNRIVDDIEPAVLRERLPNFVWYYRGLAAAHINRVDDAIADFQRLLDRSERQENPDSLIYYVPVQTNEYRYMLAVLYQRAGRFDDALARYRDVLEKDIGLYVAHRRMAEIFEVKRHWDQAISSRRYAINANPEDPSLLVELGLTLAKAGRAEGAEEALKQAMAANPRDARVPYYLGVLQQQSGKAADARMSFDRFITLAPSRYDRQIQDARQRLASLQ